MTKLQVIMFYGSKIILEFIVLVKWVLGEESEDLNLYPDSPIPVNVILSVFPMSFI